MFGRKVILIVLIEDELIQLNLSYHDISFDKWSKNI